MMPTDDDPRFERDLQSYIDWRASNLEAAPDVATMIARVAAGVGLAGRQQPRSTLRPALIAAVLTLMAMLAIGAAIVASMPPRPAVVVPPSLYAPPSPTPAATEDAVPDGVTALPTCPDEPVEPVEAGPLPEVGPATTAPGNGRIAMAGYYGVYALDPAADPPIVLGMAPPLARFQDDPLVSSMAWSPDGRWLAFVATGGVVYGSSPRQVYCQDVFVVPAGGGVAVNLTEHTAWTGVADIAWSPDGRWLAFAAEDAADAGGIFDPPLSPAPDPARSSIQVVQLDDEMTIVERRRVWSGSAVAGPRWSSRGELAFVGGEDGYLMILGPGEVVARENTELSGLSQASWAPDGDRISVVDGDGRLVVVDLHGDTAPSTQALWVPEASQADGGRVERRHIGDAPAWTPDGRAIVMTIMSRSSSGQSSEIVRIGAEGEDPSVRSLLSVDQELPVPMRGPLMSPDGSLIAYSLDGVASDDVGVWVMGADGSDQWRVSAPLSLGSAGPAAWQPIP